MSSTGHMTHWSTSSRRHRWQIQRKQKRHGRRSGCGGPPAEARHVWHDSGRADAAVSRRLCTGSAPVRCKRFLAHRASWGDAGHPTTFRTIPQYHSPRSTTTPHDPTPVPKRQSCRSCLAICGNVVGSLRFWPWPLAPPPRPPPPLPPPRLPPLPRPAPWSLAVPHSCPQPPCHEDLADQSWSDSWQHVSNSLPMLHDTHEAVMYVLTV